MKHDFEAQQTVEEIAAEGALSIAVHADGGVTLNVPTERGYLSVVMTYEQAVEFNNDFYESLKVAEKIRKSIGFAFSEGGTA